MSKWKTEKVKMRAAFDVVKLSKTFRVIFGKA